MRAWTVVAIVILLALSCGRTGSAEEESCREEKTDSVAACPGAGDLSSEAMRKADSVLSGLTLEQRVGQCFMPAIYADCNPPAMNRLRGYIADFHVGGIVLLKGDLRSAALMAGEGGALRVPMFIAIDAEWGLGMRLKDAPGFPRNGRIGAGADEDLLFDYGREVARECRRVGINMVLGPVVDVAENPHGVIGSRSFGSDPVRVADLGVAYAKGLESGGVVSVAKHFPGHGSPCGDSHVSLPVIRRSLNQIDSIDLYPFRSYIDAGLTGVMAGHLAVPAIDPESLPAAVSPVVIGDLLRGELGFNGLVLTDALNMGGAEGHDAAAAILAGADIVVAPADTEYEIKNVIEKVRSGELDARIIDERCRRILFHKFLIGMGKRDIVPLEGLREDVKGDSDSLYYRLSS